MSEKLDFEYKLEDQSNELIEKKSLTASKRQELNAKINDINAEEKVNYIQIINSFNNNNGVEILKLFLSLLLSLKKTRIKKRKSSLKKLIKSKIRLFFQKLPNPLQYPKRLLLHPSPRGSIVQNMPELNLITLHLLLYLLKLFP